MKKLFMLSSVALAFSISPALADHHEGGEKDGHHKHGAMFEKMDANSDGVVSKDEFVQAHEEKFNKMDADGNGEVSKEEAEAKRAEWRKKMEEKRAEHKEKKEENASE